MYYAMANGIEMIMMYFYYWMDNNGRFEPISKGNKIEHLALQHGVITVFKNWIHLETLNGQKLDFTIPYHGIPGHLLLFKLMFK